LQKSENEEETKVQENSGIVEQDFSGIEAEEKQLLHVQKNVVPELLEQVCERRCLKIFFIGIERR
jgi:hypothetical protein